MLTSRELQKAILAECKAGSTIEVSKQGLYFSFGEFEYSEKFNQDWFDDQAKEEAYESLADKANEEDLTIDEAKEEILHSIDWVDYLVNSYNFTSFLETDGYAAQEELSDESDILPEANKDEKLHSNSYFVEFK